MESELPSHMRISPVSSGMGSKLEILEAELGDTGDYRCNVSNPVGRDSRVRRLEVRGEIHVPDGDVTMQECHLYRSNYMYIVVTYSFYNHGMLPCPCRRFHHSTYHR